MLSVDRLQATSFRRGDIVIVPLNQWSGQTENIPVLNLTDTLEKYDAPTDWFVNSVWHCNHKVNQMCAHEIYKALIPFLLLRLRLFSDGMLGPASDLGIHRLALPKHMAVHLIDTVRLKLLKVAAKIVHSGRYIKFKLCRSCPYKAEVYETFENIWRLSVQLE